LEIILTEHSKGMVLVILSKKTTTKWWDGKDVLSERRGCGFEF
jgi:hypothetical protein